MEPYYVIRCAICSKTRDHYDRETLISILEVEGWLILDPEKMYTCDECMYDAPLKTNLGAEPPN